MTRETDYFKTFCKISKAFGTAADKNGVAEPDCRQRHQVHGGQGRLPVSGRMRRRMSSYPMAQQGLSDNLSARQPHPGQTGGNRPWKRRGTWPFPMPQSDPRLENHAAKKAEGIASLLTVPVTVNDRTIGVLSLYTGYPARVQTR